MNRLIAKEELKSDAALVLTNFMQARAVEKRGGKVKPESIDTIKKHLKSFRASSRYRLL